ncbi:MAG: hypothetical protein AMK72_10070 [Planctomycetes bacterium SM23_25]|nr:MAG: hypothetical protein AMK72_10070 [Planctomycetes bacterium SM23_25]
MKQIAEMSVGELAAYVATCLEAKGFRVVLSGGACVTLYSRNEYVSFDLDFIREGVVRVYELRPALEEIGFVKEGRHFRHPQTRLFLDFPGGPLAVGGQPVGRICTMSFSTGVLRLLSPTDCVKDRLANYYYHGDRQSLEQALLVAKTTPVDLGEIERWSAAEGMAEAFQKIKDPFLRATA